MRRREPHKEWMTVDLATGKNVEATGVVATGMRVKLGHFIVVIHSINITIGRWRVTRVSETSGVPSLFVSLAGRSIVGEVLVFASYAW